MDTAPSAIPAARERPWLPDRDERRLATLDLGEQAEARVTLDELRLERVQGPCLDARVIERSMRFLGQFRQYLRHRPAGVNGDRGVVDGKERKRSVWCREEGCRPCGAPPCLGCDRRHRRRDRRRSCCCHSRSCSFPRLAAMSSVESTPTGSRAGTSRRRAGGRCHARSSAAPRARASRRESPAGQDWPQTPLRSARRGPRTVAAAIEVEVGDDAPRGATVAAVALDDDAVNRLLCHRSSDFGE